MTNLKVRKQDVRNILEASYPDYKGKKFSISLQDSFYGEDAWQDGSRTYQRFLKWDHESQSFMSTTASGIFGATFCKTIPIPEDVLVVEHHIFCGRDLGIRILAHPACKYIPKNLLVQ